MSAQANLFEREGIGREKNECPSAIYFTQRILYLSRKESNAKLCQHFFSGAVAHWKFFSLGSNETMGDLEEKNDSIITKRRRSNNTPIQDEEERQLLGNLVESLGGKKRSLRFFSYFSLFFFFCIQKNNRRYWYSNKF